MKADLLMQKMVFQMNESERIYSENVQMRVYFIFLRLLLMQALFTEKNTEMG